MTENVNMSLGLRPYKLQREQTFTVAAALAEFIDNSLQSYGWPANQKNLEKLQVDIQIDPEKKDIIIMDYAKGMDIEAIINAFKYVNIRRPSERKNSLGTHGIGMKLAANWLSKTWKLETTCRGSKKLLIVNFDLDKFLKDNSGEIPISTGEEDENAHFTKISIKNTDRDCSINYLASKVLPVLKQTYMKCKFLSLTVMYRERDEDKDKELKLDPANHFLQPENEESLTFKEIDFQFEDKRIQSFFSVMKNGSTTQPGIRLFRCNRLILGNSIDKNLPREIYTSTGKERHRLYGELHLDDFNINAEKTGFSANLESLYVHLAGQKWMKDLLTLAKQKKTVESSNLSSGNVGENTDEETDTSKDENIGSRTRINKSKRIINALNGYDKLTKLYKSLRVVSLKRHPVLMYAGAWSFLECLSYLDKKRDPSRSQKNFANYYKDLLNDKSSPLNTNKTELKYKIDKKAVTISLEDIHKYGNAAKHSPELYKGDGLQLIIDFNNLEEFIITFITVYGKKND